MLPQYGIIRLILGTSALSTSVPVSRWRLRLVGLEVRMWRTNACPRLIFPVAVFLKRLAAPECVFSLGMLSLSVSSFEFQVSRIQCSKLENWQLETVFSRFLRRQDGVERIALHARPELDDPLVADVLDQPFEDLPSQVGVRHFPAAEEYGGLHLVAVFQEAQHVVLFELIIVLVHVDAELHFLDGDDLLMLLGRAFLFFLFVDVLAEIHDSAHRRLRRRRYLYQVKVLFPGQLERFEGLQDADLLAFVVDHAHFARTNTVICTDKSLVDTQPPGEKVRLKPKKYSTGEPTHREIGSSGDRRNRRNHCSVP